MKGKVEPLKDEKIVDFFYEDSRIATAIIAPYKSKNNGVYRIGVSVKSWSDFNKPDNRPRALGIARGRAIRQRNAVRTPNAKIQFPRDLYPHTMHNVYMKILSGLKQILRTKVSHSYYTKYITL